MLIHPIHFAECRTGQAPEILATYGLGSCVGIALYASGTRLGGLSHCLLPSGPQGAPLHPKYVDHALHLMLSSLCARGAHRGEIQAKLVGGAQMFSQAGRCKEGIGTRNVLAAREALKRLTIPLVGEDVGGHHGRSLFFDLATGEIRVRSFRGDDKLRLL